MLTKRQKQILDFIKSYTKKKGFAPSLEEIRKKLRLNSVATIHQHVEALKSKGYLDKQKNQRRSIEITKSEKLVRIPLLGTIAAGQPIEAIISHEQISVPKNMLSQSGNHYALKVSGDSMINEGIFDGDTIIIRKQEIVENGETAVALIDGDQATVKKIYLEKNRFRLQPANPAFKPIFVRSLTIQGRVVGVLRNYNNG
jgi:SOS regulatory protein LexA